MRFKKFSKNQIITSLLIIVILAVCCYIYEYKGINKVTSNYDGSNLTVHTLDVGQADSILLQLPHNQTMLIDAGNNNDGEYIIDYLKALNISKIDYLIATHPHEDHIGGMDDVVDELEIGKMYVPVLPSTYDMTRNYQSVLNSAKNKKITPYEIDSSLGNLITDGQLKIDVIAPREEAIYSDLNNYSICLRVQFYDTVMLFMGDAEDISEKDIMNYSNAELDADILKVGHHGSRDSSIQKFLDKVTPKTAIISCGKDNDYGHPHSEAIERFNKMGTKIYRTDEFGTIVITCDNTGYTIGTATLND